VSTIADLERVPAELLLLAGQIKRIRSAAQADVIQQVPQRRTQPEVAMRSDGRAGATKMKSDSDVAEYRDASWIRKATNGGLDGDLLRQMRKRRQLRNYKGAASRPLYHVLEVAHARPQYAEMLLDALKEGADFRKPRKAERRGPTKPDKGRRNPTKPDKSARRR
jgi:hypothetical protein